MTRALVLAALAACWHGTPAEPVTQEAPKQRKLRVPTERAIAARQSPAALAASLEREVRAISPIAYAREHVVFDDTLGATYQILHPRDAARVIAPYENLLTDPSRQPPRCSHDTGNGYACIQQGVPLVVLRFCRYGDWELVGVFVAPPDPTNKHRFLAFQRAVQNGC